MLASIVAFAVVILLENVYYYLRYKATFMFSRDQKTNGQKAPSNKRGMRTRESTDMLIVNAEELVTLAGASNTPLVGKQMHELQIIKDGAIAIRAGKIVAVGKTPEISKAYRAEYILSAKGKTVLPGFVDPHTHLIFAGTREEEFEERQQGASYMEILSSGGGVLKTAKETHKARVEKLVELGLERLDTMVAHGTTTVEVKSGYGLNTEDELKILAAAKQVNQLHELNMVTTFLGAHVPPLEYRSNIDTYVNQVVDEMIPQVAQQGYAEFCDVFCDRAAFNLEQAKRVLLAGKQNGLKLKIHADQMSTLGGAEIAADIGTVTADHLNCASPEGIQALSQKGVIAVLLPAATFSSMTNHYADARLIIDSGVPVALGTDFNANNWIMNMQCVVAMACYLLKMTPAEAICAATINAAHAVCRAHEVGSLEVGKRADVTVLNAPSHLFLGYSYGVNLVEKVIANGRLIVDREKQDEPVFLSRPD